MRRRVVDATYLSPTIPATTPPPFGVADDVQVAAINELANLAAVPSSYVIVGSGKTATDAIVEAAGVMLRIDRDVIPTMAKAPTLATWELDLLRTIENVVRLGHIKHVTRREIVLDDRSVSLAPGSLVVHCAASGLQYPPLVPVWGADKIRLQTIRPGFPCFNAAMAGYVEATRGDDRERNRLCPPNTLPDSLASWARMQVRGAIAARTYGAESDIAAWANGCALNPARIEPAQRDGPAVQAAAARLADHAERGLTRMAELAGSRLTRR